MNTGMSTPEFFGIFLAAAASVASVLFMMIAYAAATARHFRVMLQYLRLAGALSIASWVVMLAVMFRCEHVCWVVRNKPIEATPVSQDYEYTVATPAGVNLNMSGCQELLQIVEDLAEKVDLSAAAVDSAQSLYEAAVIALQQDVEDLAEAVEALTQCQQGESMRTQTGVGQMLTMAAMSKVIRKLARRKA